MLLLIMKYNSRRASVLSFSDDSPDHKHVTTDTLHCYFVRLVCGKQYSPIHCLQLFLRVWSSLHLLVTKETQEDIVPNLDRVDVQ